MEQRGCIFRFADVEVDERNFSVTKAGKVLPLEPKVFKVLQFLLHHASRVVTKDELLEAVWNDCSVSESSLTRSVAVLRRLLGDDIHEPRYIATVPTVGYRFLCDVEVTEDGFPPACTPGVFSESPVEPTSADQSPPPEESRRPQRKRLLVALAALILLAGAGWFAYKKWLVNRPAKPVQRSLTRLTFDDGLQTGATWSPDGRFVAYSSDRGGKYDIWIQQISGGDPIQITKGLAKTGNRTGRRTASTSLIVPRKAKAEYTSRPRWAEPDCNVRLLRTAIILVGRQTVRGFCSCLRSTSWGKRHM